MRPWVDGAIDVTRPGFIAPGGAAEVRGRGRVKGTAGAADDKIMFIPHNNNRPVPPMSNAQRQRLFRQRNPGYYARIQATRRASEKRGGERRLKALRAAQAAALLPTAVDGAAEGVAERAMAVAHDEPTAPTSC